MKNPLFHHLRIFLIVITFLAGCNKGEQPLTEETSPLDYQGYSQKTVKQLYESSMRSGKLNFSGKNERTLNRKLNWNALYYEKIESKWRMVVPFTLADEIYHKTKNGEYFSYSDLSFFIVTKEQNGYSYEVVTKIPDEDYLDYEPGDKFSGTVLVENIYGDFQRGFQIQPDGKAYKIKDTHSGRTNYQVCVSSDWYSCGSVPSISPDMYCTFMYTQTTCSEVSDGTPTDTGYGTIGTSSGDGFNYPNLGTNPTWGLAVYGRLCAPTNWQKVGNSWTTSISQLGTLFGNVTTGQGINVELNSNCITIPWYNISQSDAGLIFASAFNDARMSTLAQLQDGTILPNAVAVRNAFVAQIKIKLKEYKPGSAFSTGPCSNVTSTNVASYGC